MYKVLKVLVVDDEPEIVMALQVHLELQGYDVDTALSAVDALVKVKEKSYDLVLTDINMPEMDGIELLEKIKAESGNTLVVMITAYTSMMKVLSSRLYGASDYILKPFGDLKEVDLVITRCAEAVMRWQDVLDSVQEKKYQQS